MITLQRRYQPSIAIPSTTMADIAFLLIIFFMLSTSFSKDRIEIDLPSSSIQVDIPPDTVTISIQENGTIHWDGEQTDIESLPHRVRETILRTPSRFFVIRADRKTPCLFINRAVQIMRSAGVLNLCLPTRLLAESGHTSGDTFSSDRDESP